MSTPNTEQIQQPVTKTEGFNWTALAARVLVVALLACSLTLIWWSYYKVFYPHLKQSRELTVTLSQLKSELSDLNRRWTASDINQIDSQVSALQTNLFTDQMELAGWLADLREQSQPAGMDVKADFTTSLEQTDAEPKFLIIPTTVTVQFAPFASANKSRTPYQKLLQLTESLTAKDKADCLTELSVESGPNSIDRAVMNFQFWAGTNQSK